jgi:tetratricopeptide (TPR) repeat protein
MHRNQLLLSVAAIGLVVWLYMLPKSVVKGLRQVSQVAVDSAATPPRIPQGHQADLNPQQQKKLRQLKALYVSAKSDVERVNTADSLASTFAAMSHPDSAAHYREELARLQPGLNRYRQAGDALYEAFRSAAEPARAAALGEKTRFYYQKVLELSPDELDVKSRMAMTYVTTPSPMQGIMMLREVLARDPDNQTALFNLGLLSMQSRQFDKALDRFRQILGKHPQDAEARLYLGICFVELNEPEQARKEFETVKQTAGDPAILQAAEQYLGQLN